LRVSKKITSAKESRTWRKVETSALNFEGNMYMKNKLRYKTQIVVFNIKPSYLSNHSHMYT